MSDAVLAMPKLLPADLEWATHPVHPSVTQIEAGVMDTSGQRLRGLRALFGVRLPSRRQAGESWVLQLDEIDIGRGMQRNTLYRIEIRRRPGIPADHHDAPHAHRLGVRLALPPDAIEWTWARALAYFCSETAIALPDLGHPTENFRLTPP